MLLIELWAWMGDEEVFGAAGLKLGQAWKSQEKQRKNAALIDKK